jgi:phage regulator Rha-like protein
VEADRQKVQFDTMKRKLDNTSKELKTAQAMIETLKDQNHEKANRIAKLEPIFHRLIAILLIFS